MFINPSLITPIVTYAKKAINISIIRIPIGWYFSFFSILLKFGTIDRNRTDDRVFYAYHYE